MNLGAPSAEYDVARSDLPEADAEHSFEKLEITVGYFATATAVFALGNRERPVHVSRYGYHTKLQWISSRSFISGTKGINEGGW